MTSIGFRPFPNAAGSLQPVSAAERSTPTSSESHRANQHVEAAKLSGTALQASRDQKVVQPLPSGGTPEPDALSGMAERPMSPFDASTYTALTNPDISSSGLNDRVFAIADTSATVPDSGDRSTRHETSGSEAMVHRRAPAAPLESFAQIPTETMAAIERLREEIATSKAAPQEASGPTMSPVDRPPGAASDISASVNQVRQIQLPEPHDLDIHR